MSHTKQNANSNNHPIGEYQCAMVGHSATQTRRVSSQKWAFLCVLFAWLIGTLVFEMTVVGAEPAPPAIDGLAAPKPLLQAMFRRETVDAIVTSRLDGLARLEQNQRLVKQCDLVIAAEQERAQQNRMPDMAEPGNTGSKALLAADEPPAKSMPAITPDSMMVDPVLDVMPVAKWTTRVAYRKLDRRYRVVGLRDVTSQRIALDQARQSALPGLMRLAVAQPAVAPSSGHQPAASPESGHPSLNDADASTGMSAEKGVVRVVSNLQEQHQDRLHRTLMHRTVEPIPTDPSAKVVRGGASIQVVSARGSANDSIEKAGGAVSVLVPKLAESNHADAASATQVAVADTIDNESPAIKKIATKKQVQDPVATGPVAELKIAAVPAEETAVAEAPEVERADATAPAVKDIVSDTKPPKAKVTSNAATTDETKASETVDQPAEKSKLVLASPESEKETGDADAMKLVANEEDDSERLRIAQWPFGQTVSVGNAPNVTLNVENTDVRTVFEMLARGYGMNILVSPDVEGTVTANVDGLTPDQTLQGVMKMCNLRAQIEQGMIYVYPAGKMPDDARVVRHFTLDFARAENIEPTVQGLLSPMGNAYTSKLSATDNLQTREAIVVVDTPESIQRIENYILQVDQAPRQVMIEARVLEIELTDDLNHGVDIGAVLGGDLAVGGGVLTSGTPSASNPVFFARIDGKRIDALLDTLETTTDAKTLATPRVMVVNGQHARIQVGQQLGFTVATVTQTSTVEDVQFLETGVVLSVTPTISRDNKIMMQVKPEVSNGQINPTTKLPEEETRELETSVVLNDHQGMVIGGLIQESDRTVIRKLPLLGDMRHVGRLFQRREEVRSRTEVIIALVPHIIEVDDDLNCDPTDFEREQILYERTKGPLLYGPLNRACRPWEPRLPDAHLESERLNIKEVNKLIP
ncbi:MAG: hypothetical protein HKN47_07525 [Pirellulaceae bacterium]|nr:hypothetical protein [Pirellulaceae bacterium]